MRRLDGAHLSTLTEYEAMLSTNKQLGRGGAGMQGDERGTVAYMIRQLQQRKEQLLTGAAANTNITVAGIKVGDHISSAFYYAGNAAPVAVTASVTSNGNIQVTTVTTGGVVMLSWMPDVPTI